MRLNKAKKNCSIFSFSFLLVHFVLKFAASRVDCLENWGGLSGAEKHFTVFHRVLAAVSFRPRLLNLVRCPKPPSWNNPLSAFKLFRKLFKARPNASSYFADVALRRAFEPPLKDFLLIFVKSKSSSRTLVSIFFFFFFVIIVILNTNFDDTFYLFLNKNMILIWLVKRVANFEDVIIYGEKKKCRI